MKDHQTDLSLFLYGKTPPSAIDLEKSVLGALLLETDAYDSVNRLLQPECFIKDSHRIIYDAIVRLHEKGLPCDFMSVTNFLRTSGDLESVGGAYFVTELTSNVASAANIEHHAQIIFQKFIQRDMIRIAMEVTRDAFEDTTDPFELHDKALASLNAIMDPVIANREVTLKKQLSNMVKKIAEAQDNHSNTLGFPAGYPSLDVITNGFVPGELTIIAARSGAGKTSLGLCIARNLILRGTPVDIYSLETNDCGLLMKFASAELGIPYTEVQRGKVDWSRLLKFESDYGELPLSIQDTTNVHIEDLVARARLRKKQHGVQVIVVDYLQLLKVRNMPRNSNREQEVATISRSLKALAKDTDIAVIALAQLKRTLDERADKRPQLADLRESSAQENDADKIIFLYRPAHHKIYYDSDGYSTAGVAMIDVAKNRNGAVSGCKLEWHPSTTTFTEFAPGFKADFEPLAVKRKKKHTEAPPVRDISEMEKDEENNNPLPF